jgi:hypothetical protein
VSAGVDCDYFLAKILGSGEVAVGGVCGGAEVTLSGSGDFWGRDLNALETDVEIKGSGDAEVWAEDYLKATIMGSGDIRYRGTPAVDQSIFGSGRVRPM